MKTVLIKRRRLFDTETKNDITILGLNELLLALENLDLDKSESQVTLLNMEKTNKSSSK
jgi:hypothetical protein